jgi:hypothetical protein
MDNFERNFALTGEGFQDESIITEEQIARLKWLKDEIFFLMISERLDEQGMKAKYPDLCKEAEQLQELYNERLNKGHW